MANALELVSDYIKARGYALGDYLKDIRELSLELLATSTRSNMVRDAALRPLIRLLEEYSTEYLQDILDPVGLVEVLLEQKLKFEERKLGATRKIYIVRGSIYHTLGLIA